MATQTALPSSFDAAGNHAHAGDSHTGSDSGSSHNKAAPAASKVEAGIEAKQIADLLEAQHVQVEGDAVKDPTMRPNGLPTWATGFRRRNHSPLHRSLMRKMDWQIVPIALIVYFLSFLDRSNIATGRLNGLEADLKMTSPPGRTADYTIAVVCLYPPYILFEIPSNLFIKRVSPKYWIPGLLTAWGVVSTLQGTVTTKEGLYVARAFLGFAEAGILPGLALWLTFFYKNEELMLRQALYFSGASLSGAFSGLLSVAIGNMRGIGGKGGWAWIFIIEGLFTILVGILLFFVLPSHPGQLKWVTPDERALAVGRKEAVNVKDVGSDDVDAAYREEFRWSEVRRAFLDIKNLLGFVVGFVSAGPLYSLSYFLPTVVKLINPSYSNVQAQLMSCPPYGVAFVVTITLGFLSDRWKWRYPTAVFSSLVGAIGFLVALTVPITRTEVRYGAIILAVVGCYSAPPAYISWISTFNAGDTKRAVALGMLIMGTNTGGLASTWLFPAAAGPYFKTGFTTCTCFLFIAIVLMTAIELLILRDNQAKADGKRDYLVEELRAKGYGPKRIRIELGDRHPDFRAMP